MRRQHRAAAQRFAACLAGAALLATWLSGPDAALAQGRTQLRNICHVKGQEENTLQGLGLVVGLPGTGDGGEFLPAIRSLASAMQLMGSPLGQGGPEELEDVKNVALVLVTATVPARGSRQGSRIDCVVSSIGKAKSLAGGRLFPTPLQGPQINNPRVYAFAQGTIHVEDSDRPTTGRITGGCRLEEDFFNAFTKDGYVTLVLEENHAGFQVAQDVADLINRGLGIYSDGTLLAKAVDAGNIVVEIPPQYREDPVGFVAQLMSLNMVAPEVEARVVVNEQSGSVVIGGDVTISPVVVTHRNIVIEAGGNESRFVGVAPGGGDTTRLKDLVAALNAINVPEGDIIEIIKGLHRNGKLHAKLIVE